MRFLDRGHAGQLLAAKLEHLRSVEPVILGLTRGGIPVAFEVAHALAAPLDLVVVRKLGAPGSPERVVAAIAEGGATFLNPTLVHEAGFRREDAVALAGQAVEELARRVRLYRDDVPAPRLAGRTVVVVDDFVVTGTTARAAARAARQRGSTRVLFAVPVLAAAVERELRSDFDEVVAVEIPPRWLGPAEWYEHFEEVSDQAALALLRHARLERSAEEALPGLA